MTAPAPRRTLGALWMLLPAAAAAVGAAVLLQRPGSTHDVTPPRVADPDGPVAALGGRLEAGAGPVLVARLAPLHPDPTRQAFEAGTLQARLGLEAGEPWRLSLRCEGTAEPDGPGLPLGPVEVTDERGTALRSIPAEPGKEGAGAADPLRALLAPPGGALGPGQQVDWVLWGRAPGPGARLSGPWVGGAGGGGLELEPLTVRRSELELPVARLDRSGAAGKTAAAGPSE